MRKKLRFIFLIILFIAIIIGVLLGRKMLPIATGFAAKNMCSCVFLENRNPAAIQRDDLDFSFVSYTKSTVDLKTQSVTSTLFGMFERRAIFDAKFGCTLDYDGKEFNFTIPACKLQSELPDSTKFILEFANEQDLLWQNVNRAKLEESIDNGFISQGNVPAKTRSVLVIKNGKIIGEKHVVGIDRNSMQLGWSMTKSLMNTWVGMKVYQNGMDIDTKTGISNWQGDDRKNITYRHLLQMNTGLQWKELYGSAADVTQMLYKEPDVFKYATSKTLQYDIGTHWDYASGTTNILSGLMRDQSNYDCFLQEQVFNQLGMSTAFIERDQAGNFIASSYGFASASDWAKFGLFYLNDGVWEGERLLPKGWVDWTREPANGSDGRYGAHFWLNASGWLPDVPRDMFSAHGFQGQRLYEY